MSEEETDFFTDLTMGQGIAGIAATLLVFSILVPGVTSRPKVDYSIQKCPNMITDHGDASIELNYKNSGGIEAPVTLILNGEGIRIEEELNGEEKLYKSINNGTYKYRIGLTPDMDSYSNEEIEIKARDDAENISIDFSVKKRLSGLSVTDLQSLIFGEMNAYAPNSCNYVEREEGEFHVKYE
jgi:hypothetical protein